MATVIVLQMADGQDVLDGLGWLMEHVGPGSGLRGLQSLLVAQGETGDAVMAALGLGAPDA